MHRTLRCTRAAVRACVKASGTASLSSNAYPSRPSCGVAVVVLREINNTQQVLMVRRGKEPDYGRLSLPGGSLHLGETVVECARREILEETGLQLSMAPSNASNLRSVLAVPQVGAAACAPLPACTNHAARCLQRLTASTATLMAMSSTTMCLSGYGGHVDDSRHALVVCQVAATPEGDGDQLQAGDDALEALWLDVRALGTNTGAGVVAMWLTIVERDAHAQTFQSIKKLSTSLTQHCAGFCIPHSCDDSVLLVMVPLHPVHAVCVHRRIMLLQRGTQAYRQTHMPKRRDSS